MLKFLLIKEIFCSDISGSIIMNVLNYDFIFGRCCQIVLDRTKNIRATGYPKRKTQTINYIRKKTDIQIVREALDIINDERMMWGYKYWNDLIIECVIPDNLNNFYYGRVIQCKFDRSGRGRRNDKDWIDRVNFRSKGYSSCHDTYINLR